VTPERLWNGKFRVPLDGVSTGGNFGKRRILNGKPGSPHGGVDFLRLRGRPYMQHSAGMWCCRRIVFFGNTVVVDHGRGSIPFYGHLSEIDVKVGDDLEAGAVLAKWERRDASRARTCTGA